MTAIMSAIITLSAAFLLRIFPSLFFRGGLGVDHWYWKTYIESYRRERRFPPVFPQYILDEHQWYPPLFPLLMARLPAKVFDRYSNLVAIIIDLLRMGLLLGVVAWLSGGSPLSIGIAGLVYATMPILISFNIQLNPRGLGALFLDILIILLLFAYAFNGPSWILGIALLLSGFILLTHKMTTQLFWFLCLGAGVLTQDWRFFLLIPLSILVALAMSKGFYWNVMRAHLDIVTFWHRNWRWLVAHPIKESPIYGEEGYETPDKFHRKGVAGFLNRAKALLAHNQWGWILIVMFGAGTILAPLSTHHYWIFWWMTLSVVFVILTIFVPFLKSLGVGQLYFYNAAFPTALLWGITFDKGENIFIWSVFFIALAVNLFVIFYFYNILTRSKTQRVDEDFERVINFLRMSPTGVVMCLPPQWYDVIAYKTGQPVLYGGHGYGFKLLEPVYPRLMMPMQEIIARYKVRYLVTVDGYLNDKFYGDLPFKHMEKFGPYTIFCL